MSIETKMELYTTAAANLSSLLADICGAATLDSAQTHAQEAVHLLDNELKPAVLTAIQIGKDKEVSIEDLLMKLALAEQTVTAMAEYFDHREANHGAAGDRMAPDQWAVSGTFQNLADVSHALKAACWGYENASDH